MIEIPLVGKYSDKVASVDDEFSWLRLFRWCGFKDKTGVIYAQVSSSREGKHLEKMHRMVLDLRRGDKKEVDHINHNGLDNRLENLRIVSRSQNLMNARKMKDGNSKFKGVCWNEQIKKWSVNVRVGKKQVHVGVFGSELEAAKAYDEKVKELFGEFACLNI